MKLRCFPGVRCGAALAGAVLVLASARAAASPAFTQTPAAVSAASGQAFNLGVLGGPAAFADGVEELPSTSQLLDLTSNPAVAARMLRHIAPGPDPTAALFALALLGFCTLARMAAAADTAASSKTAGEPTPR